MTFITRWKAKRELKKAAELIERITGELPSSVLRQAFPHLEPFEACNMLLESARKIRAGL